MYRNRKSVLFIFFVGLSLTVTSFPGRISAQISFPAKPITMIIDQGPGGNADIMTRALVKASEKELGQPIVCENKPGGGMTVARNYVLKSKADGYTLGTSSTSTNIFKPHMEKLPYDVRTDQVDIAVFFKYAHALVVRADALWNTFEDVIAYARQNPGKFTYSTAGVGTIQHIVMEQIAMKERIKWSMVPFKSGSELVLACVGGHVNAAAAPAADIIPQIEAGKLRLVFALNESRWRIAPNVPCAKEKYGFFTLSYKSIYGPVGIPAEVTEKLEKAFKNAVDDPSYVELTKTFQVERYYMSGKDYNKLWKSQYDEMGRLIKILGLGK